MKLHSLTLSAFAVLLIVPVVSLAASQDVSLAPGWNIVSTPKVLASHEFSAEETSENFDIYVLNGSGWSTMATLGQSEFTPLWGYFVNNKTSAQQTLTFYYAENLSPNQKFFERTFAAPGWYSLGIANPTYAKPAVGTTTDSNNPSRILSLLTGAYDMVVDFTDAAFPANPSSVALSDPWKSRGPGTINSFNDFRETKGYAAYVSQAGARYGGLQTEGTATSSNPGTDPDDELNGSAGAITLTATTLGVEDLVLTSRTENVLGINVEASGSDLRITNIRVRFTKGNSTVNASDEIASYFNEVSILANGEEIASVPTSSFAADSVGVYSASIPVNKIVRMGSANKTTFHIAATANNTVSDDDIQQTNDWTVAATQIRYMDATGVTLFEDPSNFISNTNIEVERLSAQSGVLLRMGEGQNNPKAGPVVVSELGSTNVSLAEFTLKAEGSDMTFNRFVATSTVVGVSKISDMVEAFYLMKGNTLVAEEPVITSNDLMQTILFELGAPQSIAENATETYRIVAKVKPMSGSQFTNGDTIKVTTEVAEFNVNATASDGGVVTERAGSVTTYVQSLFTEGIQVSKVSESFTHNPQETAANSTGEFRMTIRVTNFGNSDVYIPLSTSATTVAGSGTAGFAYMIQNGSGVGTTTGIASTVGRVAGGTELTNSVRIGGGSSADFQLTVTFNPSAGFPGVQQYRLQLLSVGSAMSDSSTATWVMATTPIQDYRTNFSTINN